MMRIDIRLALCVSLLAISACNSGNGPQTPGVTFNEDRYKDSLQKAGAGPAHKSVTVTIAGMKFLPDNVTVSRGDTVLFVNHDMVVHNVTEEVAKAWSSGNIAANASWSYVPSKSAGYFCSIHPVMKGSITVQ